MPRYTNTNSENISLGGSIIQANGGTFDTEVFYPTVPTGVTVDNTVSLTDQVKLSQLIQGDSGDTTVNIPTSLLSDYTVVVSCPAGWARVYLNATSVTPRILGAGMSWTIKCKSRTVNTVIVRIDVAGTSVVVDAYPQM
jgi:hypothetical protein